MYHCHFEDVERADGHDRHRVRATTGRFVDRRVHQVRLQRGNGSTLPRHFAILLNEVWKNFGGDRDIQVHCHRLQPAVVPLNSRCPQTVLPNDDTLPANLRIGTHNANYNTTDYSQPNSALIQ
jgi:hypothetical protein